MTAVRNDLSDGHQGPLEITRRQDARAPARFSGGRGTRSTNVPGTNEGRLDGGLNVNYSRHDRQLWQHTGQSDCAGFGHLRVANLKRSQVSQPFQVLEPSIGHRSALE
jgi:hypothetical protein